MSKPSKNGLIQPDDITVAIFCALAKEAVAVRLVFDERLDCNVAPGQQLYVYSYGRVGEHNIVLTVPHQMGTVKASQCAAVVAQQFPNIRFALLIGIGGGIPGADADIRLGDVAVSIPQDNHPGVIEYDHGKYTQNGDFVLKGSLDKPAPILISADMSLQMDEMEDQFPIDGMLQRVTQKRHFSRPSRDVLFADTFHHVGGKDCGACDNSSQKHVVDRGHRNRDVVIHRGLILSGGGVIKNPEDRNRLRRGNEQAICYEMEAAGIMDQIPCLVIRGICDYADTHKSDEWHYYAAAVAAAYGGAILMKIRGEQLRQTSTMKDMMLGMKRIESKVDDVKEESHRQKILEWIGQKNWRHAHQAHFSKHEPGTGQWFLNHPDFKKWEVGHQQTLLCQGDPGAGKTVMASVMIDHLKSRACIESDANPTAVVFFYFSAADRSQQRPPYFMLSLMRQLFESTKSSLPKAATDWFKRYENEDPASLSLDCLISGILNISLSFARLFVVIDALDEGEESALDKGILCELFKLQIRTKLNIAATSRCLDWIKDIFKNLAPNHLSLSIQAANEDVERYLEVRIERNIVIQECDSSEERNKLVQDVQEGIKNASCGIFLLVRFHMDEVDYQISEQDIRTSIQSFPEASSAYEEIYGKTIDRIHDQPLKHRLLASKTLKWVVCAQEPLSISSLREAVSVKIGSPHLEKTGKSPIKLIVNVCRGLVTVDDNKTVRLLHHTTQEYLNHNLQRLMRLGNGCLSRSMEGGMNNKQLQATARTAIQVDLTMACITYLSFDTFQGGPCKKMEEFWNRLLDNIFYDYAARYWLHHLECTKSEMLKITKSALLMGFLGNPLNILASSQLLLGYLNHSSIVSFDPPEGFTCLHLAAITGSDQMVRFLVDDGHRVDEMDCFKRTPLFYAAGNAGSRTIQLLIELGAKVDSGDLLYWSPLLHAVKNNNLEATEELLDHGANIEGGQSCYNTPLLQAANDGRTHLVQLLLQHGANIKAQNEHGNTALILSLQTRIGDSSEMARVLINNGADINITNNDQESPLFHALRAECADIFRRLLEKGVSVHADPNSTSLIYMAAILGRLECCSLLLDAKMQVDGDGNAGTPLLVAAREGHLGVCNLLIQHGARVEGNGKREIPSSLNWSSFRYSLDNDSTSSPLTEAAAKGHLEICRLLLDSQAPVNGRAYEDSPLTKAASGGHEDICRLLRDKGATERVDS